MHIILIFDNFPVTPAICGVRNVEWGVLSIVYP